MSTPARVSTVWHGPRVLGSKAALALLAFWVLLGLTLLVPGPLRDRLRAASEPSPTAPSVPGVPGVPSAPRPPVAAPELRGGTIRLPMGEVQLDPVQDPHHAMDHFHHALARTEARQPGAITRVLHYGDSLIDLDFICAPVRRALQKRCGDGGHGFVLATRPWRWYNHMGISLTESASGWDHFRLVGGRARDGRLGLGCAAAESTTRAWVRITATEARASRIEIQYLRMPGGGRITVQLDGKPAGVIDTASPTREPGFHELRAPDANHTVKLTTRGHVRLFGLVLEREGPGVTWENLPLISARFNQFARLDPAHWTAQLKHRRPDLVLFQFGANDTISYGGDLTRYGTQVLTALQLVRRALPRSSCLVIGPLDRLQRSHKGELISPRVVRTVSDKQREVALAAGCAFWDGQQGMGGRGSMRRWLAQGLVLKDHVHLNVKGSDLLGFVLEQTLLQGYQRFRRGSSGKP